LAVNTGTLLSLELYVSFLIWSWVYFKEVGGRDSGVRVVVMFLLISSALRAR